MENNKYTILIVDDTATNIDILLDLLRDYDVIVTMDGKTALDILEEDDNIDLILLDIMMPYMDGYDVCRAIKKDKNRCNIPIVFLTAKSDDESIKTAFEVGGVDYVTKPFRPIELLVKIKTHLKIVSQQKQIIEHNRHVALEELLDNIAHQWRQPLSVISMQASGIILQKELNMMNDEQIIKNCNSIIKSTEYLTSTINNFRKILTNDVKNEKFYFKKLIDENLALLDYENKNLNNKLLIDIDKNILIKGSKSDFLQVIVQLIQNAKDIENSSNSRLIFLSGRIEASKIKITIKDNAGGIDSEIINKIFDPYFTTKHKYVGIGLGLYIVYNIIKNSFSGSIKVTNTTFKYQDIKYKGAKFEIEIPFN